MDLLPLVLLLEGGGGRELHRHAREVARGLVQRHHALAPGGVVHRDLAARHLHEHHEMVHVPVQHRGQPQLAQGFEGHLHAPRRHAHRLGDLRHVLEGDALQRRREPQAHRGEVGAMPVEGRHHGEARDAAFRRLALEDHRHARGEDLGEKPHQMRPFSCITGSNIHSRSVRFSSSRSAFTSIPGRSENSWPNAATACLSSFTSTR